MARLGSGGTRLGTLIPATILVALGVAYLVQLDHLAAHPLTARHLLPAWNGLASIVLVVNSFFTYAGIEVNAVHVDELRNPGREYLIMYVLMFIAAMRLRRAQPDHPRGYRAPALGLLCVLGAVSSVAALVIGFVPPSQFGRLNPVTYAGLILAGILAIGILPPLLLDRLRKPAWKAAGDLP